MNLKFPSQEYEELQKLADQLGLTLSSLVRATLFKQLDKVKKSGNPQDFFNF